jgi:protein-tyrosine phosphatase
LSLNQEAIALSDGGLELQRQGCQYALKYQQQGDGALAVYLSHCPDTFSEDAAVSHIKAGEQAIFEMAENRRHFFHCINDSGEIDIAAERRLLLEGTPNFRDYGGYVSSDGRRIRWGKLFRSGQLSALTARDLQFIESLDVRLVCDFRRPQERERDPSIFPEQAQPTIVDLPIDPGSTTGFYDSVSNGNINADEMAGFMCDINREFALEQTHVYKTMFRHLLALEDGASLVHCAAGKDRTGFAAAVVLSALGVDRQTIMADYMLTDRYFNPDDEIDRISKKYQWGGSAQVMRPMLEARELYLLTAFDAIDQSFSCMDEYLDVMLGVGQSERQVLQDRYLF